MKQGFQRRDRKWRNAENRSTFGRADLPRPIERYPLGPAMNAQRSLNVIRAWEDVSIGCRAPGIRFGILAVANAL